MTRAEPASLTARDVIPRLPWLLIAGLLAVVGPTMFDVASKNWTTEEGSGGPIIFALSLWLGYRGFQQARQHSTPGSEAVAIALMLPVLLLYILARITSTIEIEVLLMYLAVLVTGYALIGFGGLRMMWFPVVFMLFSFPPPDTLFAMITQPLKILISQWAVGILSLAGYPIANSGVTIQIGQYQMLVAAACSGINSLISLTALGIFYSYMRRSAHYSQMIILILCIIPIAIIVNLLRVMLLILITYHFGDAAGQGFFHNFAGLVMFGIALILTFGVDSLMSRVFSRRSEQSARFAA